MFWNYFAGYAIASLPLCFYMLVTPVVSSRSDENIESCINPDTTTQRICSGRGECISGICSCYPRRSNSAQKYSGEFCQCDDYSCPYHNDLLCGGHGRCICGVCMCDEGYMEDNCACPSSSNTCMASNGKVCNGVGLCECGVCRCDPDSMYKGPTCEECPTCPGKCAENKNCALCVAFMTGPYTSEECQTYCRHVDVIDVIDEGEVNANDYMNLCQFVDEEDDCRYYFTYEYRENNNIRVQVQTTKVCPASSKDAQNRNVPGGGSSRTVSSLSVAVLVANFLIFMLYRLE